jgi:RNA polymerase subunit RPABC4/transcription elongation factor Spt4
MPTYKHPCPHCAKYIARDVAACPFCGTADPFAPARCPNCRAVIGDGAWVSCPKCGQPLPKPAPASADQGPTAQQPNEPPATAPAAPAGQPAQPAGGASRCSGCGAPLPAGARFCTVCGTLAD